MDFSGYVYCSRVFVLKVYLKLSLLQEQLEGFEAILKIHPDDLDAIEVRTILHPYK